MKKNDFPILEFDDSKSAIIEASKYIKPKEEFKYCVITFLRDVIERMKENNELKEVACMHSETIDIPIYETIYKGKKYILL